MTQASVAREFVEAINRQDLDCLVESMTEDHLFVDSGGVELRGRDATRRAWRAYFALVPDYRIELRETVAAGEVVMLLGTASGSGARRGEPDTAGRWNVPAAWRARVTGERIAGWQVFADGQPQLRGAQGAASAKDLVRSYYEEVVSTGSVDLVARFVSPDYVEVHEGRRYPLGIEGAREHILGVRRTYPDLRLAVEQQIGEGEWVVSRVTMRGTHSGEWMGMKPTGEPLTVTAVNVDRVAGGRIVEHGGAANLLEPLLQAGAIRVVGEP